MSAQAPQGCPPGRARQRRNSRRARPAARRPPHDRWPHGGAQSLHCLVDRTQRCIGHAAGILDRQRRDTGVDGRRHRLFHCLRRCAETIAEVGIQRQRRRRRHQAQMGQRGLQRNRAIRPPFAPGTRRWSSPAPGSLAAAGGGRCPRPTDWAARNNRACSWRKLARLRWVSASSGVMAGSWAAVLHLARPAATQSRRGPTCMR